MNVTWERVAARMERRGDNEAFIEVALPYVRRVADEFRFFTVDDVSEEWVEDGCPGGGMASDPRAWGLVMRRARKLRIIEPTSHFVPSRNETCHGTPRRVWQAAR